VVVPIGKQLPLFKFKVGADVNMIFGVLQLSVAVGATHVATTQFSVVESTWFIGQLAKTGAVFSLAQVSICVILTVKEQVAK
jgi:hypothetical protein